MQRLKMSVGVPCLVTSEGASKEVVSETGLIVMGIDEDAIVASLCEYLSYDVDHKLYLKKSALERANNHFNFEEEYHFKKILTMILINSLRFYSKGRLK